MPDLLETIAEADATVLSAWAAEYHAREPQLGALPEDARARELPTLAREFTRRAMWAADTAEGWLAELVAGLRDGMGGHKLRALLTNGRVLCDQCRSVVEIARGLWHLAGMTDDDALIAIDRRLAAVETEITALGRKVKEPSAEWVAAFMQRAMEQPRSGKWLTPEEARALIRKAE